MTATPAGRSAAGTAAAWLLLLIAGQAAALLLIHAGNLVGYQHYIPWRQLVTAPPAALAIVAAQATLVTIGCLGARGDISAGIRRLLPGWRPWALLAAVVLTSATLSRNIGDYAGELAFATVVQLVMLGNAVLFARALPSTLMGRFARPGAALFADGDDAVEPGGPGRTALAGALWVTLAATVLGLLAYQQHPHVPDEVVYLRHAQYFAKGLLWLPSPPVPEAFNLDLFLYEPNRWYSPVPIGWPLIAAVGAFLGNPWLVNPVLAGINVLLASMFLREIYPRRTARLTILLMCASPWHVFMAMNLMTHTWTLTAALAAALAVARLRRDPRARWAVLGGAGIGMVALVRPLEGFAVALLLGVWSLAARGRRFRFAPSALLTLVSIAVGASTLPYNAVFTGRAAYFPIMMYTDRVYGAGTNALGFGPNRGLGWPGLDPFPGHGAIDVLVNANQNLFQINIELLGWGCGAALVMALGLLGGRLRRADLLMVAVIAMVAGIHSFYWFSGGPDFGARYWYLVLVPCLALAARGVEHVVSVGRKGAADARARVFAGAAALTLVTLLVFFPWRAADKYYHYRGMRPDIRTMARTEGFGSSLVLVRGRRHPDFASAAVYNPLDLRAAAPIYAWDRGAAVRAELRRAYPDRTVWIVEGPSLTHDGYRIAGRALSWDAVDALPDYEPAR